MLGENYPDRVDRDEQPEATIENVPDDIIKGALSIATRYVACPECRTKQFVNEMPGHNTTAECRNCGFSMRVVG